MASEIILLRLIHVLGGIMWVGSGVFTAVFLIPALRASATPPGPLFAALGQRRMFLVLPTFAVLTILSGARLLAIVSGGFSHAYMTSTSGRTLAWSGVAAILAFVLSLLVARPAAVRGGKLSAAIASAPAAERARLLRELARVQRLGGIASTIALTLLVIAASGMAVARYL